VLDFLDQNLKNAIRAEKLIGLKVVSIFPKIGGNNNRINLESIKNSGINSITRRIIFNKEQNKNHNEVDINLVFSIQEHEGKTFLIKIILQQLASIGYKVIYLTNKNVDPINGVEIYMYSIDNYFHKKEEVWELLNNNENTNFNSYDYLFVEIPGVLDHSYPINLFKSVNHSYLVTRANRPWLKADSHALIDILETTKDNKPQVLLNGVELIEMETIIGDLPKKRTFFRRLIKNIIGFGSSGYAISKKDEIKSTESWCIIVIRNIRS